MKIKCLQFIICLSIYAPNKHSALAHYKTSARVSYNTHVSAASIEMPSLDEAFGARATISTSSVNISKNTDNTTQTTEAIDSTNPLLLQRYHDTYSASEQIIDFIHAREMYQELQRIIDAKEAIETLTPYIAPQYTTLTDALSNILIYNSSSVITSNIIRDRILYISERLKISLDNPWNRFDDTSYRISARLISKAKDSSAIENIKKKYTDLKQEYKKCRSRLLISEIREYTAYLIKKTKQDKDLYIERYANIALSDADKVAHVNDFIKNFTIVMTDLLNIWTLLDSSIDDGQSFTHEAKNCQYMRERIASSIKSTIVFCEIFLFHKIQKMRVNNTSNMTQEKSLLRDVNYNNMRSAMINTLENMVGDTNAVISDTAERVRIYIMSGGKRTVGVYVEQSTLSKLIQLHYEKIRFYFNTNISLLIAQHKINMCNPYFLEKVLICHKHIKHNISIIAKKQFEILFIDMANVLKSMQQLESLPAYLPLKHAINKTFEQALKIHRYYKYDTSDQSDTTDDIALNDLLLMIDKWCADAMIIE